MTQELIALEAVQQNPLAVFATKNGLDPYLEQIKEEVDAFVPDVSTKKGQDEIRSFAHKIARSKTALDNIGKELKASIMEQPKLIDAERRRVRELLEGWQEQIRRPLTELEEAEKARIAEIQKRIDEITALPDQLKEHGASTGVIAKKIEEITHDDFDYAEVKSSADGAKFVALQALMKLKEDAEKAEEEAKKAELARLEAEKKAQAEREARIKAEAKAKAEREAQEAIERAERAREEAERKAKEAQEKAEREARESKERAEREKQAAIKAEQERVAREAREKAKAEAQRKANEEHQRKINREALESLITAGFDEAVSKKLIGAIAKGAIKNISINY